MDGTTSTATGMPSQSSIKRTKEWTSPQLTTSGSAERASSRDLLLLGERHARVPVLPALEYSSLQAITLQAGSYRTKYSTQEIGSNRNKRADIICLLERGSVSRYHFFPIHRSNLWFFTLHAWRCGWLNCIDYSIRSSVSLSALALFLLKDTWKSTLENTVTDYRSTS